MRSMRPATGLMAAELIQAAQQGERIRARSLLAMRASPDAVDDKGFSALHYAAATGRTILVQTLLRAGADVEKPTQDELHSRPLHLAATCASAAASRATVHELLGAGADPTARRADGLTATALVPHARTRRELGLAEAGWRVRGPRMEGRAPLVTKPALPHAVAAGRLGRVQHLLALRVDPGSTDETGMGALHVACAAGSVPMAQLLLRAGASPDQPAADKLMTRPLHCAARARALGCVTLLLDAGADPLRQDRSGSLPLDRCPPDHHELRVLLLRATLRARALVATKSASRAASSALLLHGRIVARGPTRELQLWDESAGRPDEVEAEAEEGTRGPDGSGGLQLLLRLGEVGVSLIDEEPREVIHLALRDARVDVSLHGQQLGANVKIGHVQLDSSLAEEKQTRFPVILAPVTPGQGDTLHLDLSLSTAYRHLLFFETISTRLAPLRLSIEQNTAARVLRFVFSILEKLEAAEV